MQTGEKLGAQEHNLLTVLLIDDVMTPTIYLSGMNLMLIFK